MLLDIGAFDIDSPVECLLCMGSSHISALPPLGLDGVPSLFRGTCGDYSKSGDVRAVQSDMTSGKLVTEYPFVEAWSSGIDWRGGCSIGSRST